MDIIWDRKQSTYNCHFCDGVICAVLKFLKLKYASVLKFTNHAELNMNITGGILGFSNKTCTYTFNMLDALKYQNYRSNHVGTQSCLFPLVGKTQQVHRYKYEEPIAIHV